MSAPDTVDIKCPKCGRWLSEAGTFGRAICRDCKWEVTVRLKREQTPA